MQLTTVLTSVMSVALLAIGSEAYSDNCKGSSNSPSLTDCQEALKRIDKSATYTNQAQFSVKSCYMIYATNGEDSDPVSGQTVYDTANSILNSCGHHKGSYGTNNDCTKCHVTVNYRKD